MQLPSGPTTFATAATLGKYFCALIDDPSWIRRRVETVQIVDLKRVERRVTLDVDMSKVTAAATAAGLDLEGVTRLPVPLALLKKTLMLDFDVRDGSGTSLPMATSDEDSGAAHAMILHRIATELDATKVSEKLVERLYAIAKGMPTPEDYSALVTVNRPDRDVKAWQLSSETSKVNQAESDEWVKIFTTLRTLQTITDFTLLFMPTVYLQKDAGVTLVKYRYVERESVMARPSWFQRLGWTPSDALIEAPTVGRAQREHLRLVAPPGLSITRMFLTRIIEPADAPFPAQEFERRVALERGVLYSTGLQRGMYMVVASLVPTASEFAVPALMATIVSAIMLLGGAWFQAAFGVLADAQSTIALLLLAPSSVAAYLTRRGEHQLLGRILAWLKVLVWGTALASLAAAAVIVLQQQNLAQGTIPNDVVVTTWFLAGCYSALVAALLAVTAVLSSRAKVKVGGSLLTITETVHPLPA